MGKGDRYNGRGDRRPSRIISRLTFAKIEKIRSVIPMALQDLQPQLLSLSAIEKAQAIQFLAQNLNNTRTGIEKPPGVCGGDARVVNTRIPVWVLIQARNLGNTEVELLVNYPSMTAADLTHVWDYAADHLDEINQAIRENEEA